MRTKRAAIYSNLTSDFVALNNRHRLRWDWSPFNNGLLSNELVLSACETGLGGPGILPPVSRCCDSKELEINLGYNNFFCGPRPTTRINQISSFRASALASRSFLLSHSRPPARRTRIRAHPARTLRSIDLRHRAVSFLSPLRGSSSKIR